MDTTKKYEVGYYTSRKTFKVLKEIKTQLVKEDKSKTIRRAYGIWAGDENSFLSFSPNTKTYIDEKCIKLPAIIKLIDSGMISRTL